jgi:hypothetical protein
MPANAVSHVAEATSVLLPAQNAFACASQSVLITDIEHLRDALQGREGTLVA